MLEERSRFPHKQNLDTEQRVLLFPLIIVTSKIVTITEIVTLFWPHENVTIMSAGSISFFLINFESINHSSISWFRGSVRESSIIGETWNHMNFYQKSFGKKLRKSPDFPLSVSESWFKN